MIIEDNEDTHKTIKKQLKYQIVLTRLADFGKLGFICDYHTNSQTLQNDWMKDHKGPENIHNTVVKYGKMFNGHHMASAVVR